MKSIKRYLIIALTVSISIIASLGVVTSLIIQHDEMQPQLDATLAHQALMINSLLDLSDQNTVDESQNKINSLPSVIDELTFIHPGQEEQINKHLQSIQFLVFALNSDRSLGSILLHSPHAPHLETVGLEGFSNVSDMHLDWRTYTLIDNNHVIVVFQKMGVRTLLESRTATRSTIVIACSFLLIYLIITYLVNRCLSFLSTITQNVRRKKAHDLSPISIDHSIPSEITPLIEALNQLFHTLDVLLEQEKRFAADAAHELKTPIATLKTQIQVCMNHPHDSPFIKDQLEKMLQSIDRQSHTVEQLLTLSRSLMLPHNDSHTFNAITLIQETIADLTPMALKKDINLELNSLDSCTIKHSPIALSIVIRNIIDNAIRYSPPNSLIAIHCKKINKHLMVEILDQGPGIPDEMKTRVFERFFRIVGTKTKGSGLGLSIVKHIVNQTRGAMTIDNRKDQQGLRVSIKLPTHV